MSVFHPAQLEIKNAAGRQYYILHSPQDWIKIDQHPRVAETQLSAAGASVHLQLYNGGHGWQEDPYGNINRGIKWLEKEVKDK